MRFVFSVLNLHALRNANGLARQDCSVKPSRTRMVNLVNLLDDFERVVGKLESLASKTFFLYTTSTSANHEIFS